jgi:hypothetical protein
MSNGRIRINRKLGRMWKRSLVTVLTRVWGPTRTTNAYLCQIPGYRGDDYEESRLLGYKNQVCTSQETHHVSATELSQLMLCKI